MTARKTGWGSVREVAADRGWTAHHTRRLIRQGLLETTGSGPSRRVSWESVDRYDRKKADMSVEMSVEPGYARLVVKLLRALPALSDPASAARRLGLQPERFAQMIEHGAIPTVSIGSETFVPVHWLARRLSEAHGIPVSPLVKAGRR